MVKWIVKIYEAVVLFFGNLLGWKEETAFQFARYVMIGTTCAAVDIGIFTFIVTMSGTVTAQVATTISWIFATIVHFMLNKYLNFKSYSRPVTSQLATYSISAMMSYLFMMGCITLFVDILSFNEIFSKVLSSALNLLWSFPVQKFLTFGEGIIATIKSSSKKKKQDQEKKDND